MADTLPRIEHVLDTPRLLLPALQAYCRAARVAVTIKRNNEIFTFNGHEVRCRYLSDQSAALDPRLVFPLAEGIAYVAQDTLQMLGDTGEFRIQEVQRDGSLGSGMRNLAWDEMVGEIAAKLGPGAVTREPGGSVREVFEAYGACTAAELDRAEAERGRNETLGEALIRLGTLSLEDLLGALVGTPYLYRPPHHGPLALGKALLQAGKISAPALAEAIAAEAQQGKPLRQTLVESRACHFADLEAVHIPEIQLPPADQVGEILVRQGLMSHSDLLHYLLQSVKQDRDLLDLIVEEAKVSQEAAHEAVRRHDLKRQIRQDGRVRLGEILALRGRVTQDQVLAAVLGQMERPDFPPLGHLLVEQGLLSPEELAAGLLAQDERIEALVDKDLKGGDTQEPQRGAGFRRGPAAGAGGARAGGAPGVIGGAGVKPQGHGRRRKLARGVVGVVAGSLVLLGSAGYVAYMLGPGKPKVDASAAKVPGSLAFLSGGQADGDLDDAFLTIADVKRGARKPGAGAGAGSGAGAGAGAGAGSGEGADDVENPVYQEEIAELEQYVEAQQAEMAKMQKVAKIARTMAPLPGSGEGGQLTMDDLARMASRMEARAGAGAQGGTPAGARAARELEAGSGVSASRRHAGGTPALPGGPDTARGSQGGEAPSEVVAGDLDEGVGVKAPMLGEPPGAGAGDERVARAGDAPLARRQRLTAGPRPTKGPVPPDGALNTQALLDIANGSYGPARDALAEAVKLEPNNPVTLFNLALCDYHLKRYDKALPELARARVQLEAGTANLLRLAGPAIAHRIPPATGSIPASGAATVPQQAPEAIRSLIRVTTLLADTVTYQGHAREAMGEKALAAKHFKEAIPLYRRKAALQTALADLYRADGALGEASKGYAAAARIDPRYPAPWLALHEIARVQQQGALAARYLAVYRRLASGSSSR